MDQSSFNVGDKFKYYDFTYIITEKEGDSYILEDVTQSSEQLTIRDKELRKEPWVRIYAEPQMPESLNGLEHYFLWCSHGTRVSS